MNSKISKNIQTLIQLTLEKNDMENGPHIFVNFSGHVNAIDVSVFNGKWTARQPEKHWSFYIADDHFEYGIGKDKEFNQMIDYIKNL